MWSLECKHQMLTHDGRRTTTDDGQPLTTIAHHEHFVLRWAKNKGSERKAMITDSDSEEDVQARKQSRKHEEHE